MNDAIESNENMDVSNPAVDTRADESIENTPKETDVQVDVGPNVGTSLGQPVKPAGVEDIVSEKKEPSVQTDLEEDENLDNSVKDSHTDERGRSGGDFEKDVEEVDSDGKKSDKEVVDVTARFSLELFLIILLCLFVLVCEYSSLGAFSWIFVRRGVKLVILVRIIFSV